MTNNLDLRHLRYFVTVAKHLNFSEAAKQLHITQPSLGRQIVQLEQEVGAQLFIRNTRSVHLTKAGSSLMHDAQEILLKTELALNRARQISFSDVGSLQIGFMSPLEKYDLPHLIKQFRKKSPNSNINFLKFGADPLNQALETGKIDVAFAMKQDVANSSNIHWELTIFSRKPGLIISRDHKLATKEFVKLSELANEHFIVFSQSEFPKSYDNLCELCNAAGFTPNIVAHTLYLETLLLTVETGIGIAVHPGLNNDFFNTHNLAFVPITDYDQLDYDSVLAWKKDNTNPLITLFLETMKEEHILI
ncbi:MAG: transcriptional regulator AlsR family [Firmicutes bacterium]|nr:transcriptional regulator AlsR family [Bacillota bacterium]